MICSNCGNEQEVGKFCGKCGGALGQESANEIKEPSESSDVEQAQEEIAVSQATGQGTITADANESMEKVKQTSQAFGNYIKQYLKQPASIFTNSEREFTNGLISNIVLAVLLSITVYMMAKNVTSGIMEPSFLSFFSSILIFTLISQAIVILILFVINKLFGTDCSLKEMVSIYGTHILPIIGVVILSLLLILFKSYTYGSVFVIISYMLLISVFPLYLISSLLTRRPKSIDPLYGYVLYIVAVGIALSVFAGVIIDSMIGEMIDDLMWYL